MIRAGVARSPIKRSAFSTTWHACGMMHLCRLLMHAAQVRRWLRLGEYEVDSKLGLNCKVTSDRFMSHSRCGRGWCGISLSSGDLAIRIIAYSDRQSNGSQRLWSFGNSAPPHGHVAGVSQQGSADAMCGNFQTFGRHSFKASN